MPNSLRPSDAYFKAPVNYAVIGLDGKIIINQCWLFVKWASEDKFLGNLNKIRQFQYRTANLKTSSAKWRPYCIGLYLLIGQKYCRQLCISFKRWKCINYVRFFQILTIFGVEKDFIVWKWSQYQKKYHNHSFSPSFPFHEFFFFWRMCHHIMSCNLYDNINIRIL